MTTFCPTCEVTCNGACWGVSEEYAATLGYDPVRNRALVESQQAHNDYLNYYRHGSLPGFRRPGLVARCQSLIAFDRVMDGVR